MSIPTSQLETWKKPGADDSATKTNSRIKNVLKSNDSVLQEKDKSFDVYLQGSYKNSTNIYADSDVDQVVQLNSTWRSNTARLSQRQKSAYNDAYLDATYTWEDFHEDVLKTLRDYYGKDSVDVEDRALVLDSSSLPLTADVVVCQQYRRYKRFKSKSDQEYYEGIVFWDLSTDEKIVSYPKIHYKNGAEKNQSANSRYRETVRIIKNARSYLVEKGEIKEGLAPSYCIECLLYNVPSRKYTYDLQDRYRDVVDWLVEAKISDFKSQNEIQDLFGNKSTQWDISDANEFIRNLVQLWNDWYDY